MAAIAAAASAAAAAAAHHHHQLQEQQQHKAAAAPAPAAAPGAVDSSRRGGPAAGDPVVVDAAVRHSSVAASGILSASDTLATAKAKWLSGSALAPAGAALGARLSDPQAARKPGPAPAAAAAAAAAADDDGGLVVLEIHQNGEYLRETLTLAQLAAYVLALAHVPRVQRDPCLDGVYAPILCAARAGGAG
jgi:hypothetical protein